MKSFLLLLGGLFFLTAVSCDFIKLQNPFAHPSERAVERLLWKEVTGNAAVFPRINFSAAVTNGDTLWITAGQDETGTWLEDIWSSPDGENWSQVSATNPVGPMLDPAFASFGGELFLRDDADLYFSTDGVNWGSIPDPFGADWVLRLVEMNGELWAISMSDGRVFSSPTPSSGGTWSARGNDDGFPGAEEVHSAVAPHDNWIYVLGSSGLASVWRYRPADGWEETADGPAFERDWPEAVSYDGKLWMIGGWDTSGRYWSDGSSALNDAWYSTDGKSWTRVLPEPEWPVRERFEAEVMNGRIYIFGGAEDITINPRNDVWSTEGEIQSFWDL